jgi:hypothetical protein
MPRQAVPLKKYRCGTSPVSKMSDNEDATAALWYSSVLSVKNSVGEPIPEFPQDSEQGSKSPSSVDRQDAGDVLPYQPSGPETSSQVSILGGELTTFAVHSRSQAGNAEVLAGGSSNKNVNCSIFVSYNPGEIAGVGHIGIVMP